MQVAHKGFDGLDIAIQGNVDQGIFDELVAAKELAQERKQDTLIWRNGVAMHVAEAGARGYQIRLSTGPLGAIWLIKRPNAKDPWGIFVSFRSLGLAVGGLKAAKRQMTEMLEALGVTISPFAHSINRVDFAVDFYAPEFVLDPDHFVMHSSTRKAAHTEVDTIRIDGTSGRVTGVTVGGMPRRQVTIYDKRREVIQQRKAAWWEIWNSYSQAAELPPLQPSDRGQSQVWRVELRAGKSWLKDRWGIRTFLELESHLGNLFAATLDEVRYACPTGDSNRARWPDDPIWRAVRRIVSDALFAFTSSVTPEHVKRINRLEHSRMLREQLFGSLASLAVLDGVAPEAFSRYAKNVGAEFSLRAKETPDEIAERMRSANDRYIFM